MSTKPRHPYVTLRWFAGGLLAIGLINWINDVMEVADREGLGDRLGEAALTHPILWVVAFGGVWLATLVRPSRATPWLTSFILLIPYAWLVLGQIYLSAIQLDRGKINPDAVVAQIVLAGLTYAYHRFAWMWWWRRRREIRNP